MRKVAIICLLAFAFCSVSCSFVRASSIPEEKVYEISEAELMQLEMNLNELSSVNAEQRERLTNLQERLKDSEMNLEKSERNSKLLNMRLDLLSKELTEQTASLENANRLLQEYEQEEQRTKHRIEKQRNMAYVLAAIVFIFSVAK